MKRYPILTKDIFLSTPGDLIEISSVERSSVIEIFGSIPQFFNVMKKYTLSNKDFYREIYGTEKYILIQDDIKNFDISSSSIDDNLIKVGKIDDLVKILGSFNNLSSSVADELIKAGKIDDLVKNLGSFKSLSSIADELIKAGKIDDLVKNLGSFKSLSSSVADKLNDYNLGK